MLHPKHLQEHLGNAPEKFQKKALSYSQLIMNSFRNHRMLQTSIKELLEQVGMRIGIKPLSYNALLAFEYNYYFCYYYYFFLLIRVFWNLVTVKCKKKSGRNIVFDKIFTYVLECYLQYLQVLNSILFFQVKEKETRM